MPKIIDDEKVYTAVIEVLVTQGYEGTTSKKLAAAARMHEATLFRKYGSKINLIEKAITQQLSTTPLSKAIYTGDLRADLQAIVQAYIDTHEIYGDIFPTILLELPRHPELRNTLHTPRVNLQGVMRILDRYQEEGQLTKEPLLISLNVLLGPLMLNQIFPIMSLDLEAPIIDPQKYVDAFLDGRTHVIHDL
jgi:AcrR family transcriptional regulator